MLYIYIFIFLGKQLTQLTCLGSGSLSHEKDPSIRSSTFCGASSLLERGHIRMFTVSLAKSPFCIQLLSSKLKCRAAINFFVA